MKAPLHAIAQRRAVLSAEIDQQRLGLRESLGAVSQDLALAGLGLIAGRMLVRRPWLRALALGALAAFAARRVAVRR